MPTLRVIDQSKVSIAGRLSDMGWAKSNALEVLAMLGAQLLYAGTIALRPACLTSNRALSALAKVIQGSVWF